MALLFASGCDLFATKEEAMSFFQGSDDSSGYLSFHSTGGRFGGGALGVNSNPDKWNVPVSIPAGQKCIFHAAVNLSYLGSSDPFLQFIDQNGTSLFYLDSISSTSIQVRQPNGNTLASFPINQDTWYWLEVKFDVASDAATWEVRLDGASVASGTGADLNFSATQLAQITLYSGNDVNSTALDYTTFWDDIIVCDDTGTTHNDYLGDTRIHTALPTGDGASAQWTPLGAGTHFSEVDEAASDGDTTHVEASTVGNRDTFTFPALSVTPETIHAVQVVANAKKTDANTRLLRLVGKSGASEATGDKGLGESYGYVGHIIPQDPGTASAWTKATVDAAEFGIEVA